MSKLLTIYGSSRRNGNTEALTQSMLKDFDSDKFTEVNLLDYHIEPIIDERHTLEGFQPVDDDYEKIEKTIIEHEGILFVTPLYWYGMSGNLKLVVDRFSQSLKSKEFDFREIMKSKKMYVIVVGGPTAHINALPLIQQFQLIARFFDMEFGGYVIGKGVKPQEVLEDEASIISVKQLGKKIKNDLMI